MRIRTLVVGGVAAAAIAGGTGIALAQGNDDDRSLTQPTSSAQESTTSPSTSTSTSIPNGGVSSDEAQAIALRTAGAPGAAVTKVEREVDGGLDVWEIELREGNTEWDFDVIVATGEIREWDKDIDDRHDDDRHDDDGGRHGSDDD